MKLSPYFRDFLIGTAILIALGAGILHEAYGQELVQKLPATPRVLTVEDMKRPPVTAVSVVQCSLLVALYATLDTGELVKIDIRNHGPVDFNKAIFWANGARFAEQVEPECPSGPVTHV